MILRWLEPGVVGGEDKIIDGQRGDPLQKLKVRVHRTKNKIGHYHQNSSKIHNFIFKLMCTRQQLTIL